jgi:hypothetical protein
VRVGRPGHSGKIVPHREIITCDAMGVPDWGQRFGCTLLMHEFLTRHPRHGTRHDWTLCPAPIDCIGLNVVFASPTNPTGCHRNYRRRPTDNVANPERHCAASGAPLV